MIPRIAGAALLAACSCRFSSPTAADADEAPASYTETIRGSDVTFEMVWIEEGRFWIGRHEVTWDEYLLYCDFAETNAVPPGVDAVTKPSKPLDWTPYDRDWGVGRRPAVGMSWNAAKKYCEWLSLNTGATYRLPTENEWLLACGTGYPKGDAQVALKDIAWYAKNSKEMTQEVGLKLANEHGLHDVLGNLSEYCANPFSPDEPERAVLRGGAWCDEAGDVTPTRRLGFDDDWVLPDPNVPPGVWWVPEGHDLGLRVLRPGPARKEEEP